MTLNPEALTYEVDCDELGKFIARERLNLINNDSLESDIREESNKKGAYWSISLAKLPYSLPEDKNERDDICSRLSDFLDFYSISTVDIVDLYELDGAPVPENLLEPAKVWIARGRICFF